MTSPFSSNESDSTIFLLGAGTSHPAGISLINEMTADFLNNPLLAIAKFFIFGDENSPSDLNTNVNTLAEVTKSFHGKVDLELIMSLILRLEEKREKELLEKTYPKLAKIDFDELQKIKTVIQGYIRYKCENIKDVEYLWPLEGMSKDKRLKIYTLNYDGTIEIFCEKKGIDYTDGFDPDWNPKRFDDSKHGINLYKLHGSLYWFRTKSNRTIKVPIKGLEVSKVKYLTDETVSEMMIYPTLEKNKQSGVYSTLSQKFKDDLSSSGFCVVMGYSFRDGDIRESIRESLSTNKNLWLIIASPNASTRKTEVFSDDEEISSRILTMDMGFKQAFGDRTLILYLNRISAAKAKELQTWTWQSTSQGRLDQEWTGILRNYVEVSHHDRIKWLVSELSKKNFTHTNNNFPDCIEGVVCPQSIQYMFEYAKKGIQENLTLWKKIFVESCLSIEYRYFVEGIQNIVKQSNPVRKEELPYWCMDGGQNSRSCVIGLLEETRKVQKFIQDGKLKSKLDKLIETLDFLYNTWHAVVNLDPHKMIEEYKKRDLGLKKWATEIINSLKC